MAENDPFDATFSRTLQALSPEAPSRTEQLRASVEEAAEAKRLLLGGGSDGRQLLATALNEGNDLGQNPVAQDLANLDYADALRKYGPEVARAGVDLRQRRVDAQQIQERGRSGNQRAEDAVKGIGAGAISSLGGIAAFGMGMNAEVNRQISPELGARSAEAAADITRATQDTAEGIRDSQSFPLREKREQAPYRAELDRQDIAQQYERDVEEGRSLPGLRRLGREIVASAQDFAENPALAGDITMEGVGSLLGSAGINGIAVKGGAKLLLKSRGITGKQAIAFLRSPEGRDFMQRLSETGMPATIGAMEAGGAYTGIQAEIQAMSEEELLEGSPEYQAMRQEGMSHEMARDRIANVAGLEGGAIQGLVGAAAGKMVARFEADPLKLGRGKAAGSFTESLRDLGRTALKEGGEEALQGASGSVAADLAIQRHADEDREGFEGLGSELVAGAVAGVGMGAGLRAPQAAATGALSAGEQGVRAAVDGIRAAGRETARIIDGRAQAAEAATDAQNPTGKVAVTRAGEETQQNLEALETSLADQIVEEGTESDPGFVRRVNRATRMTGQEINEVPSAVKAMILDEGEVAPEDFDMPRMNAFAEVFRGILEGDHDQATKRDAALWIFDQAKAFEAIQNEDLSNLTAKQRELAEQTGQAINTMLENRQVNDLINEARRTTSEDFGNMPEITEDNMASPEVQDAYSRTVQMAQANPAGVDPRFVAQLLDQRAAGRMTIREAVVQRLKAAAAIAQEAITATQKKEAILKEVGSGKTREMVREEILRGGKNSERGQWGLSRHLSEIVTALGQGRREEAQSQLDRLRNFGEHMQNKVRAAGESAALNRNSDNRIPYRTWTGTNWLEASHKNAGSIYIAPNAPDSLVTGREAVVDAETVRNLYNNLLTIYGGELTGEALPEVEASPILRGSALEAQATPEAPTPQAEEPRGAEAKAEQEPEATEPKETTNDTRADNDSNDQSESDVAGDAGDDLVVIDDNDVPEPVTPTEATQEKTQQEEVDRVEESTEEEDQRQEDGEGDNPPAENETGKGQSPSANERAALEALGVPGRYAPMSPENKARVQEHIGKISGIIDQSILDTIKEIVLDIREGKKGYANWKYGVLALSQKVVGNLGSWTGDHVLYHELAHFLDYGVEGGDGLRSVKDGRLSSKEDGDIYREIIEQVKQDAKLKNYFSYALSHAEDNVKSSELFAELMALAILAPEQTKERFPNGYAYVLEILRTAGAGARVLEDTTVLGREGQSKDARTGSSQGQPQEVVSFGNLATNKKGVARFTRAYTIDASKAPLMRDPNPAGEAVEILQDIKKRSGETQAEYEIDPTKAKHLANLIEAEGGHIVNSLNAALEKPAKNVMSGKKKLIDILRDGDDITSWKAGKVLSLVDMATGKYDPRLLQSAVLGAIHWALNAPGSQNLDVEEVAKAFGVDELEVTPQMMAAANNGVSINTAVESLARTIQEFWGAEANGDAPLSDTMGISQALAAEILKTMEGRMVTRSEFKQGVKTYVSLKLRHESTEEKVNNIGGMRRVLADAFLPAARRTDYFDAPPPEVRKRQKGNVLGRLGQKMRKALRRHQEIRFYRNTPYTDLMGALGFDTYVELMGYRQADPELTNKIDLLSIEGKNTSLLSAWNGVVEHNERLEAYAAATGKDPSEVATHFDWYTVSNERIHAEGFNPQAIKAMREAFVSTRSTLDLSKPGKDLDFFWLTVAQSSDLVKTEQMPRAEAIKKAQELIGEKYDATLHFLEDWLETGGDLSQDAKDTILAELGTGSADKILHALLAVARYNHASSEERAQFQHNLSLEADGKTDGPINAMIHFIAGQFQQSQLTNLAKGGAFFGGVARTLNEHFQVDGDDLYQTAAKRTESLLAERLHSTTGSPASGQAEALMRLMNGLIKDKDFQLDWEKGEIEIGRGTLKNPLTITVYGSGERGIAGKIANGLMEVIYAKLSEAAVNGDRGLDPEVENALREVTTKRAFWSKKRGKWFTLSKVGEGKREQTATLAGLHDLTGFEFSVANKEMLSENIQQIFVQPMSEAITDLMGGAQLTLKHFQEATQIQSVVLQERFRETVKERLAERRKAGKLAKGDFLSGNDYNAIFRDLARYGVVIEGIDNNDHHLNLSNKGRGNSGERFYAGLDDRAYEGEASLGAPTDASVSVAPLLTISRGDAEMMVNFFANESFPDSEVLRTLPVFDGLEMPADGIETISAMINEALTEAWLTNPAQDVANSYRDWLRQGKNGPLDGIQSEEAEAALLRITEEDNMADVDTHVRALGETLEDLAQSIQARKNVYKRIGMSVDHMASGESPYVLEGEEIEGDLLETMQAMYDEELAKLKKEAKTKAKRPAVEAPSKEMQGLIKMLGEPVENTDVIRMSSENAVMLISDARPVAKALADALPEFTFYFGTPEELTRLRNEISPEHAGSPSISLGQTDTVNGNVFIANAAPETVLHEMFHAATGRAIDEFYFGLEGLTETQEKAIRNLERLMGQFLDLDLSNETQGAVEAATTLRNQIDEALSEPGPEGRARAMHEFLAWSLSNQNLSETLGKSKVRVRLQNLLRATLRMVRQLFGLPATQKLDMLSNIQLNAGALLTETVGSRLSPAVYSSALNQVSGKAGDPRISRLVSDFELKIGAHLKARDVKYRDTEALRIDELANDAVNLFTSNGFSMDAQQVSAFRAIQAAMASTMEFDNKALVRVQKLFTTVTDRMKVEDLMEDPEGNDPNDRYRAQERFNVLTGKFGAQRDGEDRSNRMASFLALSQVDPGFRRTLSRIELPKDRGLDLSSADEALTSAAESVMSTLATAVSGEGRGNRTVGQSLDRLALVLGRIEKDDRTHVEKEANRLLGKGDDVGRKFLSKVGDRLVDFGNAAAMREQKAGRARNRDMIQKGARLLAAAVDENRGKAFGAVITSLMNEAEKAPQVLKDLVGEVMGITDENRGVYDLVNRVKYAVSSVRQDYREDLPKILAEQFSRPITKQEWSQLHLVLGKTDIAALSGKFSLRKLREIYRDPKALSSEIAKLEGVIRTRAGSLTPYYHEKMVDLAEFMISGKIHPGNHKMARNAEAIARLFGESVAIRRKAVATPEMVSTIDALTTLYALQKTDEKSRELLSELAEGEAEGLDFLTAYLTHLRQSELSKPHMTPEARLNGYKGFIPSEARSGARLIVADDRDHNSLVTRGFKRIGDYDGAGVEGGKRGYYFSTVSGDNAYHQGVMQTVATSVFGVDPRTGRTVNGTVAGRVPNDMVMTVHSRVKQQKGARKKGEALLPVFSDKGEVVGYERSIAPERLEALNRNTHLGEMIGAWAGRQAEEELAQDFNQKLVDRLHEIWNQDRQDGRADEYVDLSDSDLEDPLHREAWKLVPAEMRDYIQQKFGDSFMIRKDMVNNAVGYREASVGDAWIGNTRWDAKTQKAFRDTATAILGRNAFTHLNRAEKFIQAGVSVAKNTIVIRSVIVPASNLFSNFLQLATIGVGARDIYRGYTTKLVEIDQHLKNLGRAVEIKALMARFRNDQVRTRKLETELKSLEDSSKRMSIWPLIEAGEFSTISEGLTEADAAIGQGRWAEWMQQQVDRLPSQLGTLGRYAVVSRDTALFKGMSRAVQYGDFLAKATMYEHLVKREGMTPEAALQKVSEEFVNYNLLPGRTRSYAESMGATWFWAFKLRSLKIAHRHMRDNPLRALLASTAMPHLPELPGVSVGSPITDNMLSTAADGRLGYSVGWGMLWNAPSLNPWVNIAN